MDHQRQNRILVRFWKIYLIGFGPDWTGETVLS